MNITSWNERFALIDHFKPSKAAICKAFGIQQNQLDMATKLRQAGTFQPSTNIDPVAYVGFFPDIEDAVPSIEPAIVPNTPIKSGTSTTHTMPMTATKKKVAKVPQKRGRKGNKITTALLAVTTTPVKVNDFIAEHGISLQVLRQSKRFIDTMSSEDRQKVGKINVKQDKTTKELMIWKEDV